jgi:hypothetical protein
MAGEWEHRVSLYALARLRGKHVALCKPRARPKPEKRKGPHPARCEPLPESVCCLEQRCDISADVGEPLTFRIGETSRQCALVLTAAHVGRILLVGQHGVNRRYFPTL